MNEETVLTLEYYNYKGVFTGSLQGIRYRIQKIEEEGEAFFCVHTWKEPYCFEATPKEEITEKKFPFSYEGRRELVKWIEECKDK